MKIAESKCNLGCIELSLFLREAPLFREMFKELTPLDEGHNEVDAIGLLKHIVHAYDKWVIHLVEN